MLKLGKIGVSVVMGLTMALSLSVSGAFAQSISHNNVNEATHSAAVTSVLQRTNQASQNLRVQWANVTHRHAVRDDGDGFGFDGGDGLGDGGDGF